MDGESDYNHLGQKSASHPLRDVTYGHLAGVDDVTDYDHVARGKPAARSGDVIGNVYNRAEPATGGSAHDDFCSNTSRAKNRHDVINNVCNDPGAVATEADSDVDYYNVTGVAQGACDVIYIN